MKNKRGYLDPGTGTFIIQVVVAAIAGCAFFLKMFWRNICTFFSNLFGKKKIETENEETTDKENPTEDDTVNK